MLKVACNKMFLSRADGEENLTEESNNQQVWGMFLLKFFKILRPGEENITLAWSFYFEFISALSARVGSRWPLR